MKAGDVVSYRGKPVVFGGKRIEPGARGEVISALRFGEIWVAVQWEGMTRPTFHLETELELQPD